MQKNPDIKKPAKNIKNESRHSPAVAKNDSRIILRCGKGKRDE